MTPKIKCVQRFGAYGVIVKEGRILLTQKKSGPYTGRWGLPGGGIEFGETPEETLKRELLEETALAAESLDLTGTAVFNGEYEHNGETHAFHHVGMIYKVMGYSEQAHLIPEEKAEWMTIQGIQIEILTPFAKHAMFKELHKEIWRPISSIRAKVIGIIKNQGKLLVIEVLTDDDVLKGWCPPGGGIEFGETAEDALRREMREELGCEVRIIRPPIVCENFFEHHDVSGHEIIFAFPIQLNHAEIYSKERFQISESRGSTHWAEWIPIERFENEEAVLFPPAIAKQLSAI